MEARIDEAQSAARSGNPGKAKEIYLAIIQDTSVSEALLDNVVLPLAELLWRESDVENSVKYYRKAIEIAQQLADPGREGMIQAGLGFVLMRNGDTALAAECLEASKALAESTNNPIGVQVATTLLEQLKSAPAGASGGGGCCGGSGGGGCSCGPEGCGKASGATAASDSDTVARGRALATSAPIVVLMKGTRAVPDCEFSARAVELLAASGVDFVTVNATADEAASAAVKAYSGSKSLPQVFVRGALLGGCDRVTTLAAAGTLRSELERLMSEAPSAAAGAAGGGGGGRGGGGATAPAAVVTDPAADAAAAAKRARDAVAKAKAAQPLAVFYRGRSAGATDGSGAGSGGGGGGDSGGADVCAALTAAGVTFSGCDVGADALLVEALAEGVPADAPPRGPPQVFAFGEFVGGGDVVAAWGTGEALKAGAEQFIAERRRQLVERLRAVVTAEPIVVVMKGTAAAPKCKFSRRVAELLAEIKVPFGTHDILSDAATRANLRELSQWPTFPQVFVRGAFLGGHDALVALHDSGDLADAVAARLAA